jgi:phosphoglycerate dehydrogenase-like enzyme
VKIDLWIPARTPPARRRDLEEVATLHDYEAAGPWPDRLGRADMLVADHDTRAAVEAIPRLDGLRVVQTLSAGVDAVVDRIPEGITLCNASGVHDVAVAEWVVLAILASNRRLPRLIDSQREGRWRRDDGVRGDDLEGATVLILGYGSIGQAVEARLRPFGVDMVRVARREREDVHPLGDLPELLPDADIVVVLLPLTAETNGLVGARVLALMPPGGLLVNASRGGVVDTDALTAAATSGRIRAALDVTDPEPLPADHPLLGAPGLVVTPHVGSATHRTREAMADMAVDNLLAALAGERMPHCANPEVYER